MSNLNGLDVSVFDLDSGNFISLLEGATLEAANDVVDTRAIRDRYEFNQAVKQGQKLTFTNLLDGPSGNRMTNLDVSVWSIGGDSYLAGMRSGNLNVSTETKDGSAINQTYKKPAVIATKIELTTETLVIGSADLLMRALLGGLSDFNVTASFAAYTLEFEMPMLLKMASLDLKVGEQQMQKATLVGRGTPTSPTASDGLLGRILTGTATYGVSLATGGGTFSTDEGQVAVLTQLGIAFADGAAVKVTGTLELRGPLLVA